MSQVSQKCEKTNGTKAQERVMYLKKLKIGNIELENNLILAPMAGVTNQPFRMICKDAGGVRSCIYRNGKFKSNFS